MNELNESKDEDEESRSDSPPPLSSLSIKPPQKLGLQLTPTLTTSPATPSREQVGSSPKSPSKSPKTPKSPISDVSKLSPLRTPPKLATLSKPSSHSLLSSTFRSNRTARHSIDVRALPSYLAKKRQSTFGQFLSVLNPTAPDATSSSEEPLFEEPIAPTLSLGERVAWVQTSGPEFGSVRWIGRMPQITNDWTVGVEFDNCIGSGDGTVEGRRYFVAKDNFAKFLPLSSLTKVDNYAGRPRTGTMLSRMSVQLKPGQLISIQRSPSIIQQHCSLNAPHHVGHDVHTTNEKHCQCPSCNHPCAHLCKTTKPKGRRRWQDPGLAHMCHFSSKPHSKMCCGGEDLPCASKPLTSPGASWLPPDNGIPSYKTVPTEPIPRRKSVTIHDDRNAMSAPTSVERKPNPSPLPPTGPLKERRGSDLSISSLPSSESPQVFIARGVLTDESDYDSDTDRSYSPIHHRLSARTSMAGMARSLVSCFSHNSSSLREKKRIKDKRKRKIRKQKKRSKTTPSERRHRRGLSSDTSYDCETTHNSQNQTSSLISNVSSKPRTNVSPIHHKSTSMSPNHSAIQSPKEEKSYIREELSSSAVIEEENEDMSERRHRLDDETISEGNEGQDGCTSSSKSSGHLITTKADIESTQTHRSQSTMSSHSTLSDSVSPRRRKKTPAPAPPPAPSASASPSSLNLSVSSTSLPQTPTHSSTSASVNRRRASYKKNPAPTPPNLTRSLSEQKQLNMKNMINAVPSFRSEVDLVGESRKSSPFGDSIERDESEDRVEVPLNRTTSSHTISKSDASTQVTFESDYYEEICFKPKDCNNNGKPDLPKKTFNAISTFGCEVNKGNSGSTDGQQNSMCQSMSKSHSMPFNRKRNCNQKSAESCDQRYSTDLNALLSPQHKPQLIFKSKAESLLRGLSDGSVNSTATVIEFINALNDLENDMGLTDAEHPKQLSNDRTSDSLIDISSGNTSDERITVKSMPTKWNYSSSSLDSLSDSLRNTRISESNVLPNNANKPTIVANNSSNHLLQSNGAGSDLHTSASEQSLSSMSSSSTLSYASTIGSSSSTPTPITPKPYKDSRVGKHPNYPTHTLPKPRSKNRVHPNPNLNSIPNLNTGNAVNSPKTCINERLNNSNNSFVDSNMFSKSGQSLVNNENTNTVVPDEARVAQIMEQLEVAIAYGQHKRAAVLARELAIRKVACTLNRSGASTNNTNSPIIAYLYIEDRMAHRGPIPFQVYPSMSLNMLKLKVEKEFNIPSEMQKWILGKTLATNLSASLATYGITCSGCPIFLYLLTEEPKQLVNTENTSENPAIPQNDEWIPIPNFTQTPETYFGDQTVNLDQFEPSGDLMAKDSDETQISNTLNAFELHSDNNVIPEEVVKEKPRTYFELVELDDINTVANTQPFECPVCFLDIGIGDGIVLRDCLHMFCRYCLLNAVQYNEEVQVKCPFRNDDYSCDSRMQDREVKGVVPLDLYERYLHKSISTAESKIEKSFHCKTIDCCGWCEFDDNVNVFRCPVCRLENCINCQAIHENINCKQYQDQLEFNAAQDEDAKKTKEFIDNMLQNEEALRCPQCQVVLLKKWGCDWVKCSMCETEICWVTKGFRWGPKGKGDTSGGCKCNVRGVKCHPKCKYCH